jgi:nicotinate-nucleotide adenylyltransferase
MKSVGLFFGTFDPIHKGHEAIADFFLLNFFDEVWFVVTPMNPDKIEKGTSDENIRLEMIDQFCNLNKKFKCCDIEFKLKKPNYTGDTLNEIKKDFNNYEFSIIMGEDNLFTLHKWKNNSDILKHKIYVYPRNLIHEKKAELLNHPNVILSDAPMMNISSSSVREKIRLNQPYDSLISKSINDFIIKRKLYN